MTRNALFFLWTLFAPTIFLWNFDYGWRSGADFTLYYEYYYSERPLNIGYDLLVKASNKFISFYMFQILVLSLAVYFFIRLAKNEGLRFYQYALATVYIVVIFGVGHFRSVFPVIAFALYPNFLSIMGAFFHYGYLLSVVMLQVLRLRALYILIFCSLCILFSTIMITIIPEDLSTLLKINRFRNIYTNQEVHFEHRNLVYLTNFRLWEAVIYIIAALKFVEVSKRVYFTSSFLYLAFSFDAYLAQKSALFLYVFQIIGINYIYNKYVKFIYIIMFNASVAYTILDRIGI